ACRKFAGSSQRMIGGLLGVHRELTEGDREFAGSSSMGAYRECVGGLPEDNRDSLKVRQRLPGRSRGMLGRSQVRELGWGLDDAVGTRREIIENSSKVSGACREFVGNSPKVSGAYREFIGSLLRVIGGLLGVRRSTPKVIESLPGVRWELADGDRELARNAPVVH
ncbi:hypothetical protein B296_00032423, partial [Ensete ventricosum]